MYVCANGTSVLVLPSGVQLGGVNSPELVGQLVEVLPHVPVDVDFPYSCSPGLLGSSSVPNCPPSMLEQPRAINRAERLGQAYQQLKQAGRL